MISDIWRLTEHEVSEGYRGCGRASHDESCKGLRHDCNDTKKNNEFSGDDALTGDTRSHPEHDG